MKPREEPKSNSRKLPIAGRIFILRSVDKMAREIERSRTEQLDRVLTKLVGEEDNQSFAPESEYITGLSVPQSMADIYEGIGIGSRGKAKGIGGLLAGKGRKLQREFEKIENQHREAWAKLGSFLAEDEDGGGAGVDAWEKVEAQKQRHGGRRKKKKRKKKKQVGGESKPRKVVDSVGGAAEPRDDHQSKETLAKLSVARGLQVYAAQKVNQVYREGRAKASSSEAGRVLKGKGTGTEAGGGVAAAAAAAAAVAAAAATTTTADAAATTAAPASTASSTSTSTSTSNSTSATASRIVKMGMEKTAAGRDDWGVMIKKKLRAWAGAEGSPTHAGDSAHEAVSPGARRRATGLKRFPAREDLNGALGSTKSRRGKKRSGTKVKRKTKADRIREAERIAKLVQTYAR